MGLPLTGGTYSTNARMLPRRRSPLASLNATSPPALARQRDCIPVCAPLCRFCPATAALRGSSKLTRQLLCVPRPNAKNNSPLLTCSRVRPHPLQFPPFSNNSFSDTTLTPDQITISGSSVSACIRTAPLCTVTNLLETPEKVPSICSLVLPPTTSSAASSNRSSLKSSTASGASAMFQDSLGRSAEERRALRNGADQGR